MSNKEIAVSVESLSATRRRLVIGIPVAKVDLEYESRIAEMAKKKLRIPGFRAGKVPLRELKRRFGANVRGEVMNDVMQESLHQAIQTEGLKPVGNPVVKDVKNTDVEVQLVTELEVVPEFNLQGMQDLALEKKVAAITDADVSWMIESLRKQKGTWEDANDERTIMGDQVILDYLTEIDGVEVSEVSAKDLSVEIGSNLMLEGFEDQLIDKVIDDPFVVTATFPDDYGVASVQSKEGVFKVTIKNIKRLNLPELNQTFFNSFHEGVETLERFEQEVKEFMQKKMDYAADLQLKQQVTDSLLQQNNDIQVPNSLVERAFIKMKSEQGRFQQLQASKGQGRVMEKLSGAQDDLRLKAEKQVRIAMIFKHIIDEQKLQIDQKKVREKVEVIASDYAEPEKVINWFYQNEAAINEIQEKVMEDVVIDFVVSKANVSEVETSYKQLLGIPV